MSRFAELKNDLAKGAVDPDDNPEIPSPEDETDEDESETPTSKKKDKPMTDETKAEIETARTEGHDAGFKDANDRMNTVLASEHYAGREALAQNLLGNAKLSGDEIIAALAVAAKPAPVAAIDDDAKDRAEMRSNLAGDQPEATADLGNDDTTKADDSLVQGMKSRFPAAK